MKAARKKKPRTLGRGLTYDRATRTAQLSVYVKGQKGDTRLRRTLHDVSEEEAEKALAFRAKVNRGTERAADVEAQPASSRSATSPMSALTLASVIVEAGNTSGALFQAGRDPTGPQALHRRAVLREPRADMAARIRAARRDPRARSREDREGAG